MAEEMKQLKMALFSPEFEAVEHTTQGGAHTFTFKTEYIDVDRLVSLIKINGQRLEDFIGPQGRRYKPAGKTDELTELFVVSLPKPYNPYTISVTLVEQSPHFRDFMAYWAKHGNKG